MYTYIYIYICRSLCKSSIIQIYLFACFFFLKTIFLYKGIRRSSCLLFLFFSFFRFIIILSNISKASVFFLFFLVIFENPTSLLRACEKSGSSLDSGTFFHPFIDSSSHQDTEFLREIFNIYVFTNSFLTFERLMIIALIYHLEQVCPTIHLPIKIF